jgi:transposase
MPHRHAISDADWDRVKDLLPGRPGQPGWVARDNRLFVDAVLWIGKTGAPWRDLPERFGKWNSVWKRFDRWSRKGTWKQVFAALGDQDLEWLIFDSTVIRAHPHAAGAKKNRMGREAKKTKRLGGAEAVSEPRSTVPSVDWGYRSNCFSRAGRSPT